VPYAGSGTGAYRTWPALLPEQVELRAVVLPGRERRFIEPAMPSVDALADLLVPALLPDLDPPYAIFGHSMGAMLGYEVARRLTDRLLPPVHLLVSGARAPHLPDPGPGHHLMPDTIFLEAIRGLGGTPPELTENEEFLQLMLPTLRADFIAAETYLRSPSPALSCPITAFGGADDPLAGEEHIAAWAEHTTGRFRLRLLPGDHFFLATSRQALLRLIDRELQAHLDSARPQQP
jgi:medium-chain acyl-[acyl-carrier-protein] hydrolase